MRTTPNSNSGIFSISRRLRNVIIASLVGSTVEWYDFALFSASSALVFDKIFFPQFDPVVGSMLALLTYATGYLARPLGGVLFGHFGDRIGRKPVLVVSFLLMGTATVLMGLLPTYSMVGWLAPALLTMLRLVQGVAVGGEFGGAALLASESSPPERRGLFSSSALVGQSAGILLGTAVYALISRMPSAAFLTWGWRIPFLASAGLVLFGVWIRRRVEETDQFQAAIKKPSVIKAPFNEVMTNSWRRVLLILGVRTGQTMQYNVAAVFALSFGTKHYHIAGSTLLLGTTIGALTSMIITPFGGHLSDKLGRRPVALAGGFCAIIAGALFFPMLSAGSDVLSAISIVMMLGLTTGLNSSVPTSYFPELFPTTFRYTAISLGFQLGTVTGGLTPAICTLLAAKYGVNAVAAYLVAAGALIVGCVWALPETLKKVRGSSEHVIIAHP